ncbi:MAG TPA: hypothetical protein PKW49_03280 [Paludibacteraceae bacterium]|nr:hypothetical protein [Paludibacteraceae bacterium]
MDSVSEIRKSIQRIAGSNLLSFTAKVKSVQGETCTVDMDGMELTDVRLRSVVNGKRSKILVSPAVGSYIIVIDNSRGAKDELVCVAFSEIDKIEVDADCVVFNGGSNDGLVKIQELTEKLNGLKDTVNALVRSHNSHTHTVATTGSATSQSGTAAAITIQVEEAEAFSKEDYEDTKITH